MGRKVAIYDTTLRDGTQSEGVSFSTEDKLDIARRPDQFGMAYIEGGGHGPKHKDQAFFETALEDEVRACPPGAFGSTEKARKGPPRMPT